MYLLLAVSLFFMNEPVASMRETPEPEGRVASQAVFPEKIIVEKEQDDWSYIITPDNYAGWVPTNSYVKRETPYETSATVSRLSAHVYGVKDTEFGPIITLPFGSRLQVIDDQDARWAQVSLPDSRVCYIQKGDIAPIEKFNDKVDLASFSMQFLGLPYTWGGRSSFGFDCSGFTQMLYSQIDLQLQRDSKQQIKDPRFKTIAIEDLESGDLIFFGKSEEKITHVGMSIGGGRFIHSSVRENKPWIRVSSLSDHEWSGNSENFPYRQARQLKKL